MAVTNSNGDTVITDAQEADIYFFCGWPQRWLQTTMSPLEQALRAIANKPVMLALLTNAITATPKGLLAQARDLFDVQFSGAYRRLKAIKVGSIELSGHGELNMLARQGQRLVGTICSVLDIQRGEDVFRPGSGRPGAGSLMGAGGCYDSNWVGK